MVPAGAFLLALFSWNCEYTNQLPQMENFEPINHFSFFFESSPAVNLTASLLIPSARLIAVR